jgi:hypothetical protein
LAFDLHSQIKNQKSQMTNTVTWRDAIPIDLPRILELWDEQEKRFAGTNVRIDRPQLFWENPGNRPEATGSRPQATGHSANPEKLASQNTQPALEQFQSCSSPTGNHEKMKNRDVETLHGKPGSPLRAGFARDGVGSVSTDSALEPPRALDQSRATGWRYKPPIMRLRVAEKNGQIVGFRYVEAVPEVCLVTGDEDVMKTLGRELTEECYLFKSLGFRSGWGLVPEKFANALARFTRYSPVRLWKGLRLIGCDFSELGD